MTTLEALTVQLADARGTLHARIEEFAAALATLQSEVRLGAPLSLHHARVRLAAVDEAHQIVRACEHAARREAGAQAAAKRIAASVAAARRAKVSALGAGS